MSPHRFKEFGNPEFILLHIFQVIQPIPFIQERQKTGWLRTPISSTEGNRQELTDRCVRGSQQSTALHRGLLLGTFFSKFRNKDMLEILVVPNVIFQGNQSAAPDCHLQKLDVEFNPKCVGSIHCLDSSWLLILGLFPLSILVWSGLAQNSEAAFVFGGVTNTDPLKVRSLWSTAVTSLRGSPNPLRIKNPTDFP